MVRAVTFDAHGTIIDTGRDVLLRVAGAAAADHRPDLEAEVLLDTWDRYFFAEDRGPFRTLAETTEDSLALAFRDHGIDADPGPYVEMLTRLWSDAKPYPETRAVLGRLDGVRRGVVSNADDAFLKGILARNDLAFDVVVTSESARSYKPHPRIFEVALAALDVDPRDVVHVGDSLAADVAGARRLGIRSVWVNRSGVQRGPGDPLPDFEVPDLTGVPDILRELRQKE